MGISVSSMDARASRMKSAPEAKSIEPPRIQIKPFTVRVGGVSSATLKAYRCCQNELYFWHRSTAKLCGDAGLNSDLARIKQQKFKHSSNLHQGRFVFAMFFPYFTSAFEIETSGDLRSQDKVLWAFMQPIPSLDTAF